MPPNQRPQRVRRFSEEWNESLAFSQAVRAGNQLWIAGRVAVDAHGTPVGIGDGAHQGEQVWRNLAGVLERPAAASTIWSPRPPGSWTGPIGMPRPRRGSAG